MFWLRRRVITTDWNFPAGTSRLVTERLYPGETDSHPNSQTRTTKIYCLVCILYVLKKKNSVILYRQSLCYTSWLITQHEQENNALKTLFHFLHYCMEAIQYSFPTWTLHSIKSWFFPFLCLHQKGQSCPTRWTLETVLKLLSEYCRESPSSSQSAVMLIAVSSYEELHPCTNNALKQVILLAIHINLLAIKITE